MTDWGRIAAHIAEATGRPFAPDPPHDIGGGCINTTVKLGVISWCYCLHQSRLKSRYSEI